MEKRYEEYAYVLDFLAHGRSGFRSSFRSMGRKNYRAGALIQCIGENFFTLLEALVKESLMFTPSDRVYVGKASRSKVTYIIGRIGFEELTASAKAEISSVIANIVQNREKWFINFYVMNGNKILFMAVFMVIGEVTILTLFFLIASKIDLIFLLASIKV